jgi:hypothetical protein
MRAIQIAKDFYWDGAQKREPVSPASQRKSTCRPVKPGLFQRLTFPPERQRARCD